MKPTLLATLVPLAFVAAPALAADPWDAPFNFQVGAFRASANTTMRLDSDLGRGGTEVSLESDLGVAKDKTLPTFDFTWRFNPRHALEASWLELKRDGSRQITGTINWGEVTFPVNATVDSRFDSSTIRAAYRWSPVHENGNELALLFGLHYTDLKARLSNALGSVEQEASVKFPLPTIGARGAWKFTDHWRVNVMGQFLKLKINDYDGGLYQATGAVEWAFLPQAYAGLGYNYYKYELTSTKEHVRGEFNYRFDGPSLYLTWGF